MRLINKFYPRYKKILFLTIILVLFTIITINYSLLHLENQILISQANLESSNSSLLRNKLIGVQSELSSVKGQDQVKINKDLQKEINDINTTFSKAAGLYEQLAEIKTTNKKTEEADKLFAQVLINLSDRKYSTAEAKLGELELSIKKEQEKQAEAAAKAIAAAKPPVVVSNNPPGSGYSRQQVQTPKGTFSIDIISADLSSTKVIVDTASPSDCRDNCPVIPLVDFVKRNGAYAGVNGAYYCPSDYPSCAGKVNSFDLLIMNKDKTYFNSDNNVYSTNPAVVFADSWVRFVRHAQEWGRDKSVNSVISNFPLLIFQNNIVFSGGQDQPKWVIKSSRAFVASKSNNVYIGVIYSATMEDSAAVLSALGMENAMNLDGGGSTALWYGGGYKAGPGRNLTNVILFVKK